MKVHEYREKSDGDLQKELVDLARERFNLRMQQGTGQLARPNQMRDARKNVARIKTVMNERLKAGSK